MALGQTINPQTRIPLYVQLKQIIQQEIESGIYQMGDAIPNETALQRQYGISRATVRKAIEELTIEGMLVKKQGKGTFIQKPKVTQNLNFITSFGETMAAKGLRSRVTDVEVHQTTLTAQVARILGLQEGLPVTYVCRLYLADEEPIALMTNYLVPRFKPELTKENLEKHSLYHIMERIYGFTLATADETVEAHCADRYEADRLGVRKGAPLLRVTRITYAPDGSPIELAIVTSRADRYSYSIKLGGRDKKNLGGALL